MFKLQNYRTSELYNITFGEVNIVKTKEIILQIFRNNLGACKVCQWQMPVFLLKQLEKVRDEETFTCGFLFFLSFFRFSLFSFLSGNWFLLGKQKVQGMVYNCTWCIIQIKLREDLPQVEPMRVHKSLMSKYYLTKLHVQTSKQPLLLGYWPSCYLFWGIADGDVILLSDGI